MISSVSSEQHLGHIIGNQVSQECISSITNDFIKRVNVLSAVFEFTFSETSYLKFLYCGIFRPNMLKCFIPLGVNVSDAYLVFHNNLLHLICNDIPVDWQLQLRFLTFL